MSEEKVEVVERAFDAFARGAIDEVLQLCAEDEEWDDYRIEKMRVIADPDEYVAVGARQRGRGKQSGIDQALEAVRRWS